MKSVGLQTLRSRWFVVFVHLSLWVMIYLAAAGVGGKTPEYHETDSFSAPAQSPAPVARLDQLFAADMWPKWPGDTNATSAFYTRHFFPTVPLPPTVKKFELTYQGFYQSGDNPKQTMIRLGDTFLITPVGGRVISNLFVAEATMQTLTLTNPAAKTNVLALNQKKEVEVPLVATVPTNAGGSK
jgi:hypothetical protein